MLAGQFASLAVELEDLTRRLRGSFPLLLCDSLPTSRYLALPRAMLSINARQLPSYGGSLETAAADMEHYLAAGSGVLVLCGNETRARNFHRLLEERGVRARLDLSDQTLPAAGETVIGLGALSAGCEYPQLRLVILMQILNCCHPNALMTLKEYLEDYASPQTRELGMKLIDGFPDNS